MTDTVVWVHGFPLSSSLFARQRSIEGVRHLTPDLPGFGTAPPMEGQPSMERYAREVLRAMNDAGVGRATLAGVSMGGYILFALLRIAPERVGRLILIDTRETADTEEARRGRYETIEKVAVQGVEVVIEAMLPKMLTKDAPAVLVDEVRAIMSESTPAGVIGALQAMAERPDSAALLPSIGVPALVVAGAEDPITPPSDAERMAKAMPDARLEVIANAAHLPNVQQSEAFNRVVAAFLSASSGSGR